VVLEARLRDDERHLRVAGVDHDREAELAREPVPVEPVPRLAAVVGDVHPVVVLLPEAIGSRGVQQQLVHALPGLRTRIGEEVAHHARVARGPVLTAVVGAKDTGRGDADVYAAAVARVELDRVEGEPTGPGKPRLTRRVLEQGAIRLPRLAAVV
jgi:hypothetical protein